MSRYGTFLCAHLNGRERIFRQTCKIFIKMLSKAYLDVNLKLWNYQHILARFHSLRGKGNVRILPSLLFICMRSTWRYSLLNMIYKGCKCMLRYMSVWVCIWKDSWPFFFLYNIKICISCMLDNKKVQEIRNIICYPGLLSVTDNTIAENCLLYHKNNSKVSIEKHMFFLFLDTGVEQ